MPKAGCEGCMRRELMREVCKERLLCAHGINHLHRFGHIEVRDMFLVADGIYHENIHSAEFSISESVMALASVR